MNAAPVPSGLAGMRLWAHPPGKLARATNLLVTVSVLGAAAWAVWAALDWAIVRATWHGASGSDCAGGGACWAFLERRGAQFVYGFYPVGERWRVDLAGGLLVPGLAALLVRRPYRWKPRLGILMVTGYPLTVLWLLHGGLGLPVVPTRMWGGLMLTFLIGVMGIALSLPLGILLALGRRSSRPAVARGVALFIEFWRGVPLIAVLFLALIMLPGLLPEGAASDPLVLSLGALSVFTSAYMAEVIRGGLQALPPGQEEAAAALGLGTWQRTALVVLPQALRIVMPGLVNVSIALFKDTSLVMIVGLFDLMSIAKATVSDPAWLGLGPEAYVVVGLVFWFVCFGLSTVSRRLEAP